MRQKALRRAELLRSAGIPLDRVISAARSLVTPVAAYGWVGRLPTKTDCKKLFVALTKHGPCRFASPMIRGVLYGSITNLESVVAQRTLARASRFLKKGILRKSNYAGTTWHLLT